MQTPNPEAAPDEINYPSVPISTVQLPGWIIERALRTIREIAREEVAAHEAREHSA